MAMTEALQNGAVMARKLARQCLEEAKTCEVRRAFYLMAEYDRHIERAEFYERHADKPNRQEIAA